VQENNEFAGSLFDKQKGSVYGNMMSLDDESIPVLGFFEVAGVSEKKRIFKPDEFEEQGFDPELIWAGNCQDAFSQIGLHKGTTVETDTTWIDNEPIIDTLSISHYLNYSGTDIHADDGDTSKCIVTIDWGAFTVEVVKVTPPGKPLCITRCTDCRHYGFLDPPDWWGVEDED
jgi:hypothetical protein